MIGDLLSTVGGASRVDEPKHADLMWRRSECGGHPALTVPQARLRVAGEEYR